VSFLRALGCWCILNDTAPHTTSSASR
jgi:hypothetical protein